MCFYSKRVFLTRRELTYIIYKTDVSIRVLRHGIVSKITETHRRCVSINNANRPPEILHQYKIESFWSMEFCIAKSIYLKYTSGD